MFTGRFSGGTHVLRPIDPLILTQSRSTFALLILAPLLFVMHRPSLQRTQSHLAQFFLLGILGLAASNYFYYFAIEKTTVATAIVLQYVAPVWVLLYMLARRTAAADSALRVSGVVLAVVGCALAVGEIAARSSFPWLAISGVHFNKLGVVAAELAAITFAFYNVYGQHLVQLYRRWTVLVYSLLGATVFWIVVNPPWKIAAQHYSGGAVVVHAGVFDNVDAGSVLAVLHRTAISRSDPRHRHCLPRTGVGDPADRDDSGRMGLADAGARESCVVLAATILVQRPDRKAPSGGEHCRRADRVTLSRAPGARPSIGR